MLPLFQAAVCSDIASRTVALPQKIALQDPKCLRSGRGGCGYLQLQFRRNS